MLKKLQRKYMAIAMFALSTLVFVQMLAVNFVNIYQQDASIKATLQLIAENNGNLPSDFIGDRFDNFFSPFYEPEYVTDPQYSTRYFVVEMYKNVATKISTDKIGNIDENIAFYYASRVYGTQPGFGFIDGYRYYYLRQGDKSLFVFLDFQREIDATYTLMYISFLISITTLIILLIPVYVLSKKAIKPVAQSIERQKQFITDASHELKTPIAIISADTEVLEMCEGESEWTQSIRNQTVRLSELVTNLVRLSKLDEMNKDSKKSKFNLSEAVLDTANSFEVTATMKSRSFKLDIAPDIWYFGNENELKQLVSILCDNAVKYADEGGTISLRLYKSGKNIMLDMYNTCEHIDPASVSKLFDRFYRADSSRSRETGGYGIGLSIAKAIVESHKGRIKAVTDGTKAITFKVTL